VVSPVEEKLRELERVLGKGPTLTPKEIGRVLRGGVPAWLLVAPKVLPQGELADRCVKAAEHLEGLYEQVVPALPECLRPKHSD
jgi:hypothetical protein